MPKALALKVSQATAKRAKFQGPDPEPLLNGHGSRVCIRDLPRMVGRKGALYPTHKGGQPGLAGREGMTMIEWSQHCVVLISGVDLLLAYHKQD